eukprot:scaffold84100_cov61-Attheya_sp.AAC.2
MKHLEQATRKYVMSVNMLMTIAQICDLSTNQRKVPAYAPRLKMKGALTRIESPRHHKSSQGLSAGGDTVESLKKQECFLNFLNFPV